MKKLIYWNNLLYLPGSNQIVIGVIVSKLQANGFKTLTREDNTNRINSTLFSYRKVRDTAAGYEVASP